MNKFKDSWMKWLKRSQCISKRCLHINRYLFILPAVALISACGGDVSTYRSQSSDAQTTASDCRVVQHALGETCVPPDPQRVVVFWGLDNVLALEVKPVGSNQLSRGDYYLQDRFEGIQSVGIANTPNLETVVALKPDLILGIANVLEKDYGLLSEIAPTVMAEFESSADWKDVLNKYAEALGKTDKAEKIMAGYQARIDEFQSQMGDRLKETEVSIFSFNRMDVYLEDSFPGTIVADAGLPRPPAQANAETSFAMSINKELLHKVDGDVIFLWINYLNDEQASEVKTALEQLKADPLWAELNAVQQDKVYNVPGYWKGMGPIAANLVLDDLFKYLVDSPSQAAQ